MANIRELFNNLLQFVGITNPRDKLDKSKLSTLRKIKRLIEKELPNKTERIDNLYFIMRRIQNGYRLDPHETKLSSPDRINMENELNNYKPTHDALIIQKGHIESLLIRVNNLIKQKESEKNRQQKSLSHQVSKRLHSRLGPDMSSMISSYSNLELGDHSAYHSSKKCKKMTRVVLYPAVKHVNANIKITKTITKVKTNFQNDNIM